MGGHACRILTRDVRVLVWELEQGECKKHSRASEFCLGLKAWETNSCQTVRQDGNTARTYAEKEVPEVLLRPQDDRGSIYSGLHALSTDSSSIGPVHVSRVTAVSSSLVV